MSFSTRKMFLKLAKQNEQELDGINSAESMSKMVNTKNQHQKTALQKAISKENKALVTDLLNVPNIDVNSVNATGFSALHYAAVVEDSEILKKLLEKNPNINQLQNNSPETSPLYKAVLNQKFENAKLLLAKGANANLGSPLHRAILNGDLEMADELIQYGASITQKNDYNFTPLDYAAMQGDVKIIKLLNNYGLNFSGNEKAVELATLHNRKEALKLLIENGANPNVTVNIPKNSKMSSFYVSKSSSFYVDKNSEGNVLVDKDTPLHYAVKIGDLALAELCLKRNRDMVQYKNVNNQTPAHLSIKQLDPKMGHCLYTFGSDFLLLRDSDFAKRGDEKRRTLLMDGATRGIESIKQLDDFFKVPNYQLTETQKKLKEKYDPNYKPEVSVAKLSVLAAKKVPVESASVAYEETPRNSR